jgi:hypothetical protein
MESLYLKMKMNIARLVNGQKMPMAETMIPDFLTTLRKPSAACGETPSANSVLFASVNIGGRIEGVVHPHYVFRTGVF